VRILCDTCSILMLIRIAPDMFVNPKYECVTINEVRDEFIGTVHFKDKYPWRKEFKSHIKSRMLLSKADIDSYFQIVNSLASSAINKKTNRFFSLSHVDQLIAATVIGNDDVTISTGDQGLIDFLDQEFDEQNVYSLELVVEWLEMQLINWSDSIKFVLDDWDDKNEKPQPRSAAQALELSTGYRYTGLLFDDDHRQGSLK